jgi:hypothetical protein
MSTDFLLRADSREDFEAMAKSQGFMDEDGNLVPECIYDPSPQTSEYETGVMIAPSQAALAEGAERSVVPGYHVNFRVWGELEAAQIADIPQTDENGNPLPLRARTTFGLWMTELGEQGEQVNAETTTTFVTASGVSFLDPESIRTQQRVWQ